jgi:hypothetical protein
LGGERWDGEEEGEEEGETEEERKRECRQRQYILESPTEHSVGNTVGVSDTSLFGCPGLNPSVFPSVNLIHVIPPLQFSKKISRRRYIPTELFRRYIPAASPMDFFHRLIPTDFETELFPSVMPLVLSGF